jgi:prepilin-type processing-associated H-X9-DG protein
MDMHAADPTGSDKCPPYECEQYFVLRRKEDWNRGRLPAYIPWRGSIGHTQPPNGGRPDILYNCPDEALAQLERMPCLEFELAGYMSAAPRSSHFDGVNAGFLDGHVEFLLNDIDEATMAQMISINDADPGPPVEQTGRGR